MFLKKLRDERINKLNKPICITKKYNWKISEIKLHSLIRKKLPRAKKFKPKFKKTKSRRIKDMKSQSIRRIWVQLSKTKMKNKFYKRKIEKDYSHIKILQSIIPFRWLLKLQKSGRIRTKASKDIPLRNKKSKGQCFTNKNLKIRQIKLLTELMWIFGKAKKSTMKTIFHRN